MFTRPKKLTVLALACGLAACGVPGGQEPVQEPVQARQATGQPHQHEAVAWSSEGPSATPAQGAPASSPHTAPNPQSPPAPTPRLPKTNVPSSSQLPSADQEILDAHNKFRARHCAQPLRWSSELEALAQDWADQLAGANCAFEHRQPNRFGENLTFFAPVGSQSPAGVATGWYSEVQQYDFGNGTFDFQTGHFTQLVWTSTTELGCGVSRCNGGEIWVCNYNPPGNMMGDFARRVLHPNQCVSAGP